MTERGKGVKGVPMYWDELKKKHTVRVTLTCWKGLQALAKAKGHPSVSEELEHYSRAFHLMQQLQQKYHLTIRTPFNTGEPYFVGATLLGMTGWNGKPNHEASGGTMEEAINNLAKLLTDESAPVEDGRLPGFP